MSGASVSYGEMSIELHKMALDFERQHKATGCDTARVRARVCSSASELVVTIVMSLDEIDPILRARRRMQTRGGR